MTDQEFVAAITKLRSIASCATLIEVNDHALELVKRPATGVGQRARERKLRYYHEYNKTRRHKTRRQ